MRQFEFPYNFDPMLIKTLHSLDPEGKTINCIYLPPYIKDYQTIIRCEHQFDYLNNQTRQEYEDHIKFINSIFPNKIQILLQKQDQLLSIDQIKYYLALDIKNFCVASIEQAKLIKNINKNITIVGSISMQITEDKLLKNFQDFLLYFDKFVLPFSASRNLNMIKNLPKEFEYILLINAYCHINCSGNKHWNYNYKEEQNFICPGIHKDLPWEKCARIRPMDLGFFDPYISIYKLQDRGWPTSEIIKDYILYTTDYSFYPNIIYDDNLYISQKKYCYMTFTDIKFIPYVIRQSQRMKYLNMKYPYIVLIDENDEECELLLKENNIEYRTIKQEFFKGADLKNNRFKKTINKFKIVHYLNEFEKICWLDADTICFINIDNYFDEIQSNIPFWCSYDEKISRIIGGYFYITNKLNVNDFLTFVQKYQDKYTEDESLLTDYFIPKNNYHFLSSFLPHLHFSGQPKLFDLNSYFPLFKEILYDFTSEEFNLYIDNNWQYLEQLSYKWVLFLNNLGDLEESYE